MGAATAFALQGLETLLAMALGELLDLGKVFLPPDHFSGQNERYCLADLAHIPTWTRSLHTCTPKSQRCFWGFLREDQYPHAFECTWG